MKLFTKYTRINLLVMVLVFVLSAGSNYLLMNYVLIREMDADLAGIRDRIEDYYSRFHDFPTGHPLDEEQVSYHPVDQPLPRSQFALIPSYSQREKKIHNFRQMVFTLQAGKQLYKVTVAKP